MVEQKDMCSPFLRTPKSQLAVEQQLTGGCWNPLSNSEKLHMFDETNGTAFLIIPLFRKGKTDTDCPASVVRGRAETPTHRLSHCGLTAQCCPHRMGLPGWLSGKESPCQCRRCRRHMFDSWVGEIPWSRKQQCAPVFLPERFHGQRSLVGHSPWDRRESSMAEQASTELFTSQRPGGVVAEGLRNRTCQGDYLLREVWNFLPGLELPSTADKCCHIPIVRLHILF